MRKEWGRSDVLVNNAGIGMRTVNTKLLTEPQPFIKVEPNKFTDLVETNLTGYFLVARGFVSLMIDQGKGKNQYLYESRDETRKGSFRMAPPVQPQSPCPT